ncbi:conserved hypothetical protein [Cupriavidus necator]|uniref:Uncharacterized protein n=1 Tax=Cupriavidus necator TaxID=106590 RepID=A0A1K0IPX8_CUPNE|nr:conserved hypothetical protein [Cupriavidus necator]
MMRQADLFLIPPAPALDVARFEAWPLPGLTARETAQCVLSKSATFKAAIVATILSLGLPKATDYQIHAAIPDDWKVALGPWMHCGLADWQAEPHGIKVQHMPHDGGGFHFEFHLLERRHA